MAKNALAFVLESYNKYSISVLIGTVETDGRFDDWDIQVLKPKMGLSEQVEALAVTHEKVVVGFSFMSPNVLEVLDAVQMMRKHLESQRLSNVLLVAGGPHASGDWQRTLKIGFDVAVIGEGERSFPELLASLCDGTDFGDIRGLAYIRGPETAFGGRSERVQNLDDCPPFAERFGLLCPIEITRGCPWACRFCQTSFLLGGRMRHRSAENIARWAEISRQRGLRDIRFVTPDAFAYGSDGKNLRFDILTEMLEAVNAAVGREHTYLGSFPSEVRPDSVSKEAVELVRQYAANDNIIIGAQSGSQRMLDISHRGHTVEDIYRAVQITVEAGLIANVDFIFGMPGETKKDRELTIKVVQDLTAVGARIHSHTFMPLAGTPWANSPPGRVDRKTRRLLNRLAGKGQQYGQWRKQQVAARAIVRFRKATSGDDSVTTEASSKLLGLEE